MSSVVKFRKPPLIEVVFEVCFDCPELESTYFGIFWQAIKEKFPKTVDKIPTQVSSDAQMLLTLMPPLRRVWFISEDDQELIQLQNNYFAYNWRVLPDCKYPHFEKLLESFLQGWEMFQKNIEEFDRNFRIAPYEYRLTYLNSIDRNLGWSNVQDSSKVFRFFNEISQDNLGTPKLLDCQLGIELPNQIGTLSVSIDQRVRYNEGTNSEADFIFFNLNVISEELNPPQDVKGWYRSTHEFLVKAFLDLTTETIQKQWEREDE